MKRSIKVSSHSEGDALVRALDEPVLRTAMVVGGALAELPSVEQRRAVISFVLTTLANDNGRPATPSTLRVHDGAAPHPVLSSSGE